MTGRSRVRLLNTLLLVGAVLNGCAKRSVAPEPNAAPHAGAQGAESARPVAPSHGQPGSHETLSPPADDLRYATPPPDVAGEDSASAVRRDDVFRWLAELTASEAAVMTAGAACEHACRALRSMQHATVRLCELAQSDEDRARCDQARARLNVAKGVVRASCRTCHGRPALQDDGG
jgi:hypothetical protein